MAEFDSVIPAGGKGTLTAKIKTTSTQNGPVSKGIAVNTDAAGAERLMLNVRFTAVSAVMVLPRAQVAGIGSARDTRPAVTIVMKLTTPDANGFRQSQGQIAADAARAIQRARRDL